MPGAPVSATVTVARDEVGSYSKTDRRDALKLAYNVSYFVDVADANPETFGPFDIMAVAELPKVNRSIYHNNGYIIPYLVCRTKTARRTSSKLSRWIVDTTWDSGTPGNDQTEPDNVPIASPALLTDISPREEGKLIDFEEQIYEDENAKACLLPTGNTFADPFMKMHSGLRLFLTQYETSIDYATRLTRNKRANEDTYRGQTRYSWMIQDVDATEVEVQLSGGPTAAALVTYTIEYNPLPGGWKDRRALIDTHYLSGADLEPFEDDKLETFRTGLIQDNGAPKVVQQGVPDYDVWENQATTTYSVSGGGFLQA